MLNLKHRTRQAERMDQPDLDERLHRQALAGLARLNRASRSSTILWGPIHKLTMAMRPAPLRILDLACGGGDVTLELAQRGISRGLQLQVDGCDKSSVAIAVAQQRAAKLNVTSSKFSVHDVLRDPLPDDYDVLTCSLFLHHLSDAEAGLLLENMAHAARRLVLINDLKRSCLGYATAWVACHALSRSPVVRFDGPVSVMSAFTADEALALAAGHGMPEATVSHHWPRRFLLAWRRP